MQTTTEQFEEAHQQSLQNRKTVASSGLWFAYVDLHNNGGHTIFLRSTVMMVEGSVFNKPNPVTSV